MKKILVIDDELPVRILVKSILERDGFIVSVASNGMEGLLSQKNNPADLVITDLIMPEKEGIELIQELKKEFPLLPVIAMSGGGITPADGHLKTAKILGAAAILEKPVDKVDLVKTVEELINHINQ